MLTAEDSFATLAGGQTFTKLDLGSRFPEACDYKYTYRVIPVY